MAQTATAVELRKHRQVIYWRLLAGVFGMSDQAKNIEKMTGQIIDRLDLPKLITDPNLSVDTLIQRYPELKGDFESIHKMCNPEEKTAPNGQLPDLQPADLRRSLAYSKLLLNVFGPNTMTQTVTAQQYGQ